MNTAKKLFEGEPEGYITISPELIGLDPNDNEAVDAVMKNLFIMEVEGDGMMPAGINNSDRLILDRSIEAADGDIVVANVDNQLVCRRYYRQDGKSYFRKEDGNTPDVCTDNYCIYGVMVALIRNGRTASEHYNPDKRLAFRCSSGAGRKPLITMGTDGIDIVH